MQTMSDNNFWFGRPKLLLTILQYIMFDNASSVAFAVFEAWQVGSFGHCLSLTFHCLLMPFIVQTLPFIAWQVGSFGHCLSLTFHCLLMPFIVQTLPFIAWQVGSFGHCFATWPAIAARLVVALLCLLHGGFVILPVRSAKAGQTSFSCLPSSVRNTF